MVKNFGRAVIVIVGLVLLYLAAEWFVYTFFQFIAWLPQGY